MEAIQAYLLYRHTQHEATEHFDISDKCSLTVTGQYQLSGLLSALNVPIRMKFCVSHAAIFPRINPLRSRTPGQVPLVYTTLYFVSWCIGLVTLRYRKQASHLCKIPNLVLFLYGRYSVASRLFAYLLCTVQLCGRLQPRVGKHFVQRDTHDRLMCFVGQCLQFA